MNNGRGGEGEVAVAVAVAGRTFHRFQKLKTAPIGAGHISHESHEGICGYKNYALFGTNKRFYSYTI